MTKEEYQFYMPKHRIYAPQSTESNESTKDTVLATLAFIGLMATILAAMYLLS